MNNRLKYKVKSAPYRAGIVYDIYIMIQSQDDSDNNIIMMQVLPKNAIDQYQVQFSHIATPIDIQTFPTEYNRDYSYFRTNKAVVRVNSQYQVDRLLKGLASSVRQLNKAVTMLQQHDDGQFIDGTDL